MAHFARTRCAHGQLTRAEVNANTRVGTIIVEPRDGTAIRVLDSWMRAIGGAAATATAVILTDTAPTTVVSNTVGILTQNAVVRSGITNSTVTNQGLTLGKNKGLRIGCTVADLGTATHLDYMVKYVYEPVLNAAT